MRSLRLLSIPVLTLLVAACGGPQITDLGAQPSADDDDDGGTPTPVPQGSFVLSVDGSLDMDFNVASSIPFTVTPQDGFLGTVTVSLPANVAGIRAPEAVTVSVTGASPVSGSIDVDTLVYKDVIPGLYTDLVLHASAGELSSDALVEAMINPKLVLHIKAGAGNQNPAPDVWGADASAEGIIIHYGKNAQGQPNANFTLAFVNDDSVNHTIHAGGLANTMGIQHGATNMNNADANGEPGATQTRTLNRGGGTLDPNDPNDEVVLMPNTFYCHNHLGTNLASGHAAKITLRN